MISHKHKFVFVHINKCGGTSIESIMRKHGGEFIYKPEEVWHTKHNHHVLAEQYSTTKYWKQYFKFSVVRNPWEKELSDYFYYKSITDFNDTFIKYLDFIQSEYWHTNQLDWLVSKNKKMELDFIGKTENLQQDFNIVCDKIGIPRQQLPHKNKTKHNHYTEYYDDETKQLVAEKYAKDIEYFGYEFGEREAMNKKIAIIQTSPPRTASTVLMNAILGFIFPDEPAHYVDAPGKKSKLEKVKRRMGDVVIIKSHRWAGGVQRNWQRVLGPYECFFISSDRKDLDIYVNIDNDRTLVIPYEMLLETSSYSLEDIVDALHEEFSKFLPRHIELNKESCLGRLRGMNRMTITMQNKEFTVWDKFYGIHGGHRNRGDASD